MYKSQNQLIFFFQAEDGILDRIPFCFFFFKQKTAYEIMPSLVGSEMCIRDRSILNNTDKMAQFTELMTEIVGKALAANNEELGQSISEEVGKQVIKEMNYLCLLYTSPSPRD